MFYGVHHLILDRFGPPVGTLTPLYMPPFDYKREGTCDTNSRTQTSSTIQLTSGRKVLRSDGLNHSKSVRVYPRRPHTYIYLKNV
jgi:hypothetical protein